MSNSDRAALLDAFTVAWTAKDIDALMDLMADRCVFRASLGPEPGATFTGRDEVRRGFEIFLGTSDITPPPETANEIALVSADFAVTRWTTRTPGTDGTAVVVRGCDVFEFDGDRIKSKDTYRKVDRELPKG